MEDHHEGRRQHLTALLGRLRFVVESENPGAQARAGDDGRHLDHHVDQLQDAIVGRGEVTGVDGQHERTRRLCSRITPVP